jgi:two-component system cell cycle sensor histidine kinase/response regulator CckA
MTTANDNEGDRPMADIVHDLNNLLTVIHGYSEMLLSRLDGGDWHRTMVDEVHRASTRAAALVAELRNHAADAGKRVRREANMSSTTPPAPRGVATILLVEDEDAVRKLLRSLLEADGYRVLDAPSGPDALAICQNETEPIDLLVSDVIMPIIGGQALAEALVQRFPSLRVLFVSGYTDEVIVRSGVLQGRVTVLQKPFNTAALRELVRDILERH